MEPVDALLRQQVKRMSRPAGMLPSWAALLRPPAPAQGPRMSLLGTGRVRLDVDLSIGGAITHLSMHENLLRAWAQGLRQWLRSAIR